MNYKLYIHINKINGKCYVGITRKKVISRWKKGSGYSRQNVFYSAIKKYGWDNFIHLVLFENLEYETALKMEDFFIENLKSNNRKYGYNVALNKDNQLHSHENVRKSSNSKKGKKQKKEHIENMKKAQRARFDSMTREEKLEIYGDRSGENHSRSKLRESEVKVIKSLLKYETYRQRTIAEIYNVSRGNITSISRNESWSFVEPYSNEEWKDIKESVCDIQKLILIDKKYRLYVTIKDLETGAVYYGALKDLSDMLNINYSTCKDKRTKIYKNRWQIFRDEYTVL